MESKAKGAEEYFLSAFAFSLFYWHKEYHSLYEPSILRPSCMINSYRETKK